jgi:hypothetical protein
MSISINSYEFAREKNSVFRPMLIGSTKQSNPTFNKLKVYYIKEMTLIIKEIFNNYWVEGDGQTKMSGFYDFGNAKGWSVLNFFNTHYGIFCKLVNDINYVMYIEHKGKSFTPLSFHNKETEDEKLEEMKRYFTLLRHYSPRVFSINSKTFSDLITLATLTTNMGQITEERTIKLINFEYKENICENTAGGGNMIDSFDKIDAILTLDGKKQTAQIKPYSIYKIDDNYITFFGTGDAESYKTDLLIFNRYEIVFMFKNENVRIVNHNFVIPIENLIKTIGISFDFKSELV